MTRSLLHAMAAAGALVCGGSLAAAQDAKDVKFYNLEKEYRTTVTFVYKAQQAQALELKQIVRDMLSIYGSVYVNEQTNELYITDVDEKVSNIKAVLPGLDKSGIKAGNNLASRVVYLKHENASELVDILKHKLSIEGRIQVVAHLNALEITDIPSKIAEVESLLIALDVAAKHIAVEITIVDFNAERFSKVGVNLFNWLQGLNIRGEALTDGSADNARLSLHLRSSGKTVAEPKYGVVAADQTMPFRVSGDFQVGDIVDFLCENGDGAVIANTRVVAKNNKRAVIAAVENIPVRRFENDQRDNAAGYGGVQAGVVLDVTPTISEDSLINLVVAPRIVDLVGWTPKDDPITFERSLSSEVKVKAGTVFVLGGLKRREAMQVRKGIPGLKEIPVLQYLFSVKQTVTVEREVLMFIKPVIHTGESLDAETVQKVLDAYREKQKPSIRGWGRGGRRR